jgi:hypothetical protein
MSCSAFKCGFGKVQKKKDDLETKPRKSRRSSQKISRRRSRKVRRSRKGRKGRKNRKARRSHRFGFKYLRNDQIINKVFHSYPNNLTCDRA